MSDGELLTIDEESVAGVDCLRIDGEKRSDLVDSVPVEEPISVIINGEQSLDVAISPRDLEDFIVGHLVCEGRVAGPGEITWLEVGDGWIEVEFEESGEAPRSREMIFSGCFGTTTDRRIPLEPIPTGFVVSPGQVTAAMKIAMDSETHRDTGGVHSCAVVRPAGSDGVELICLREDIGRHNALDKAVGGALRAGKDTSGCLLATTGRASSEMVAKCYGARIPIICSRGATTTLAIELARMAGITLVGFVRGSRMNVYTSPARIAQH
ncbi:MAG: formate dehydrogenase accessory sulfurtransferase FdhD [Theionarchaea archaeon]|nr:formate dehydrogenase accessory sulfurtransferase FdhD [Theionarchaea archaeon]